MDDRDDGTVSVREARDLLALSSKQSVHNAIERGDLEVAHVGRRGKGDGATRLTRASVRRLAARLHAEAIARASATAWSAAPDPGVEAVSDSGSVAREPADH